MEWVKSVSKKIKNFRWFFDENWPEKIGNETSQQAAQVNGFLSTVAKTLAFLSLL